MFLLIHTFTEILILKYHVSHGTSQSLYQAVCTVNDLGNKSVIQHIQTKKTEQQIYSHVEFMFSSLTSVFVSASSRFPLITALCSCQQWLHKQKRHKCCKQMHRLHKHVGSANQMIFPHSKLWLIKILRVPLSLKDSLQERC